MSSVSITLFVGRREHVEERTGATRSRVLQALRTLPTSHQDSSEWIILRSEEPPKDVIGIHRTGRNRWSVNAISTDPEIGPVNAEVTSAQVRELIKLFFSSANWVYVLRRQ